MIMASNSLKLFSILLVIGLADACSTPQVPDPVSPPVPSTKQKAQKSPVAGELYRARYPLARASEKLISEKGEGPETLFGTRNLRAVLNGVYYRGGANNKYLKPVRRANSNPLTDIGLRNLCKEGYTQAIYFYETNFDQAPHEVRCKTFRGQENVLAYSQVSPLRYRDSDLRNLLEMIHKHVRNPQSGPIYGHCWNGWHASGYVAAAALRQFCGFSGEEAVAYWNQNTDGNDGKNYDRLRKRLREFVPSPELTLNAQEKATLCPAPGSLDFSKN